MSGLKVKHLAFLPILGLIQIFALIWYVEDTDEHVREIERIISKQFGSPSDGFGGFVRRDEVTNRDFLVHRNFRNAEFLPEPNDITLVSQCSIDNLHYIPDLVHRWRGPTSVAIFAPGADAINAIYGIDVLRRCDSIVKQFVTFHILYPTALKPIAMPHQSELNFDECELALEGLKKLQKKGNYQRDDLLKYPQNSLRNLARDRLDTKLFYLVDIDTIPAAGLRDEFNKYARKNNFYDKTNELVAFITPAFEIQRDKTYPKDKREILHYEKNKNARPFHNATCPHCHGPTKYEDWRAWDISSEWKPAYEIEYVSSYEPFYIAHTETTPYYDERFKAYGFDRISQVCEMYIKGFTFMVLNNAFVFHLGFKFEDKMHKSKNNENKLNFGIFKNVFKPDMKRKYPKSSRQCIEPKPSKNRRGGVSEVNIGGRAEVKFGSKMTQNGLSKEERERLKKAHTERLAKMNQSKNPSEHIDSDSKTQKTESDLKPTLKAEEIVSNQPEIPISEDNSKIVSEKAEDINPKSTESNDQNDAANVDTDDNGDVPP